MSEFDIYNKHGEKVGSIGPKSSFWPTIFGVPFLMVIIFICVQCSKQADAEKKQDVMSSDMVRLADLVQYDDSVNDYVGISDEVAWVEEKYPEMSRSTFDQQIKGRGAKSYDDSFKYIDEPFLACDQDTNPDKDNVEFFTYKLNGKYTTLDATVFLTKDTIEDWQTFQENLHYREENNITNMFGYEPEFKGFGLCVIFADNEVIYESPILRPNEILSDNISVSIKGADEIVICIAGVAYVGAPRVTK